MSVSDPQDWMARAAVALRALREDAALMGAVQGEIDAFFTAHPGEPRTAENEQIIAILVFERLTTTASAEPSTNAA